MTKIRKYGLDFTERKKEREKQKLREERCGESIGKRRRHASAQHETWISAELQ